MKGKIFFIIFLSILIHFSGQAQEKYRYWGKLRWNLLGSVAVNPNSTKHTIFIHDITHYNAIRFVVTMNPVSIDKIEILHKDGELDTFEISGLQQPNVESNIYDFVSHKKQIKSITVYFKPEGKDLRNEAAVNFYACHLKRL